MTAQAAGLDERVLMHSSRAPRADLSFSARTSHGEFSLLANSFKLTLLFLPLPTYNYSRHPLHRHARVH